MHFFGRTWRTQTMSSSDQCGFGGGVESAISRFAFRWWSWIGGRVWWWQIIVADRLLGFKSAWQIGVEALGGRDSDRYRWVNRCCQYCSYLFQPKISRCWTWVMVSWSFLGLWFGGYVNFVEIFGFLGGCLLVVSRFVVSRCLFMVWRVCKYCWNF